jgi:hypothetical protein
MAKCANCGRTIAFGGIKDGEHRFCGKPCRDRAYLNEVSIQLPDGFVMEKVHEVHSGACGKCGGAGPVDMHTSHSVWSALFITRWAYKTELCCSPCGRKAKLRAAAFSGLLGWWGFPWGILITPAQIIRNVSGLLARQDPLRPSDQLVQLVRTNLSAQLIAEDHKRKAVAAGRLRMRRDDLSGAA